jgi:tRNA modification GTPase
MPASPATIFALSSGRPPAAIAVVRISGPRAKDGLAALTAKIPEPRRAALRRLRDGTTGAVLDDALVLWLPGPNTETGEDMVELHLHGGRAVVAAVLAALGKVEGLRGAEAGEFTRRAFENGRLDLTAVEGLADLIFAETEAQRAQAMRQLSGALGDRAEAWRTRLVEALALVEAGIDFSDEADVPEGLLAPALYAAQQLVDEIEETLRDEQRGERLREGLVVAIAGPPNAGKSSLLNAIAKRDVAIVSPNAGTTRDVIEVHLDLGGYPVTLLDTAGIRDSNDPVEQEGVRRARERAAAADLVLWVTEAGEAGTRPEARQAGGGYSDSRVGVGSAPMDARGRTQGSETILTLGRATGPSRRQGAPPDSPDHFPISNESKFNNECRNSARKQVYWFIHNKADLLESSDGFSSDLPSGRDRIFAISAATGLGVAGLIDALAAHGESSLAGREPALVTRERHRTLLRETVDALRRALAEPAAGREDIVAEELRLAARSLGRLTGRVDVEDILDVIFRDFCIGK